MTDRPYIPTPQENGEAWRAKLGLASIEQARVTPHTMMGSHIDGWCYVCDQPKTADQHGPIHLVADGEFACGIEELVPMSQRTLLADHTTCGGCLAVLDAAAVLK